MPIFEYHCGSCDLIFERLIRGAKKADTYECRCGKTAHRRLSKFGVSVRGSGSRKAANASVDEVVGADAERRWEHYKNRREKKKLLQEKNPGKKVAVAKDHSYVVVDP